MQITLIFTFLQLISPNDNLDVDFDLLRSSIFVGNGGNDLDFLLSSGSVANDCEDFDFLCSFFSVGDGDAETSCNCGCYFILAF